MTSWSFVKQDPRYTQREPIQGEFFNTDDIDTQARELVREAVQNSLDAAAGPGPVRVRIYVSGHSGALEPDTIAPDLDGLWDHVLACPDPPDHLQNHACPFVVIEDFGTTGLTGDARAQFPDPAGPQNHYYYFFRAEGSTGKAGGDRGRWGLGKFVFPKASEISTFFGVTCQQDGEGAGPTMLMGKSILKSHRMNGSHWMPDGWFAQLDADEFQLPIDEPARVTEFTDRWAVTRAAGMAGLSVVIPYADPELTAEAFVHALVAEYFVAVLQGKLIAEVVSPDDGAVEINASSLRDLVENLPPRDVPETRSAVQLVQWRLALEDDQLEALDIGQSGQWPDEIWSAEEREERLERLRSGESMAFRVPVQVHRRGEAAEQSHVEVLLQADDDASGTAIYSRGGIIIPGVGGKRHRGVRAIVLAEDPPVTRFLGDAENPAHTRWLERGDHFRGKYEKGPTWLRLIRHLPGNIVQSVRSDANNLDETILERWFSVPMEGGRSRSRGGRGDREGAETQDRRQDLPPNPRWNSTRHRDGSIVLRPGDDGAIGTVAVTITYDAVDGGARRWDPLDFTLDGDQESVAHLSIEVAGADHEITAGNEVVITVNDRQACEVRIDGLDPNRDVVADIREVSP